jgi:hypothetical protein
MTRDPWKDDDPQPGDFDALLARIDPVYVERHDGDPEATLRILVSVDGEDARRLERIAEARGQSPHDVIAVREDEHVDQIIVAEDERTVVVFATVCTSVSGKTDLEYDGPCHVYLERPLGGRTVIDGSCGDAVPYKNVYARINEARGGVRRETRSAAHERKRLAREDVPVLAARGVERHPLAHRALPDLERARAGGALQLGASLGRKLDHQLAADQHREDLPPRPQPAVGAEPSALLDAGLAEELIGDRVERGVGVHTRRKCGGRCHGWRRRCGGRGHGWLEASRRGR